MDTNGTKTLAVAIDFGDNLAGHEPSPKRMYTPDEVLRMTRYFRDIGVRRLYWFHNAHDALFDKPFGGAANLLVFACDAAHECGMTVLSVIKPFETGIQTLSIPPHLIPPTRATRTIQGWHVFASQFAADHSEMRLQFRPKAPQPPGSGIIRRIRLVNRDDTGASLEPGDIEILWSDKNSQFRIYDGPTICDTHTRQQKDGAQRVLDWHALELPAEARYILLRYRGEGGQGDFVNAAGELLEIYDETGRLTSQPDQGHVPIRRHPLLSWGLSLPVDTKAVIEDPDKCGKAFEDHFLFESNNRLRPARTINRQDGYICHCLDFNTHVAGALHPGYPEVRQYWLDWVRRSLDCGVDGVALRIANHSSWCTRGEDAGFNEPALDAYAQRTGANPDPATADLDLIRVINGDFYMQFVRECSVLVRAHGKRLEHFIQPLMDRLADNRINNVPETFHFDYRQWLREGLLDGICMRPLWNGADNMRFGDMVGALARLFDVDMIYANQNGPLNRACSDNEVPEHIGDELRHARDSELFDGYILYEASGVMGIDESGRMHTSTNLERCVKENWE